MVTATEFLCGRALGVTICSGEGWGGWWQECVLKSCLQKFYRQMREPQTCPTCIPGTPTGHSDGRDFASGGSPRYTSGGIRSGFRWPGLSALCQSSPLRSARSHLLARLMDSGVEKGLGDYLVQLPHLKGMQRRCQKRKIHPDGCPVTETGNFHMQKLTQRI